MLQVFKELGGLRAASPAGDTHTENESSGKGEMATEGRGRGNGYSCPLRFDFVETQGARRLWGRLARWIQRARRPRSLRAQRGGRQRPPLLPVCGLLKPESSGFLLARNLPTPSLLCCSTMVQSATPQLSDCTTRTEKACDPICRPRPDAKAPPRRENVLRGPRRAWRLTKAPRWCPSDAPRRGGAKGCDHL